MADDDVLRRADMVNLLRKLAHGSLSPAEQFIVTAIAAAPKKRARLYPLLVLVHALERGDAEVVATVLADLPVADREHPRVREIMVGKALLTAYKEIRPRRPGPRRSRIDPFEGQFTTAKEALKQYQALPIKTRKENIQRLAKALTRRRQAGAQRSRDDEIRALLQAALERLEDNTG